MCAFSVWERVGWVDDVREAFATLPGPSPFPDYVTLTKSWGSGGDWHEPAWVEETVKKHGYVDVSVESIAKDLTIANAAEFSDTISVMIPMILKRFWTEEERGKNEEKVMPAILKYMTDKYGEGKPISMHWVAILVTARKPL